MYKPETEGIEKPGLPQTKRLTGPKGSKNSEIHGCRERKGPNQHGILKYNELSDEELASIIAEDKDEGAFNEIVDRYADKIFRLALRTTYDLRQAEDVMQEVFLTIEMLDTFCGESKFSSWLYRVAVRAGYMKLRADKGTYETDEVCFEEYVSFNEYGVLEGVLIKDWSGGPNELLFGNDVMELIERSLNELPAYSRIVFHLRDVEGLSNQEVAYISGISIPGVKSRLRRARLYLRDKLSNYFFRNERNNFHASFETGQRGI